MNKTWAVINRILPFSCVDGPGNRFVIFFQGCNYRCLNCHNPYTIKQCRDCGECVERCPNQALSLVEGKIVWAQQHCEQCDTCIQSCAYSSTPMASRLTVEAVLKQIRHYLPFLDGITVSGGEATLQLPFIIKLFQSIKRDPELEHLSCLVDSNGSLAEQGWHKIFPIMDGAMIDLKAWDENTHKRLTGRDNYRVKESIKLLALHQKLQEIRLLLIPGQTDLWEKVNDIADFILALNYDIQVRINAFQTHGVVGIAKQWESATEDNVQKFANCLKQRGITRLITPSIYLS